MLSTGQQYGLHFAQPYRQRASASFPLYAASYNRASVFLAGGFDKDKEVIEVSE